MRIICDLDGTLASFESDAERTRGIGLGINKALFAKLLQEQANGAELEISTARGMMRAEKIGKAFSDVQDEVACELIAWTDKHNLTKLAVHIGCKRPGDVYIDDRSISVHQAEMLLPSINCQQAISFYNSKLCRIAFKLWSLLFSAELKIKNKLRKEEAGDEAN